MIIITDELSGNGLKVKRTVFRAELTVTAWHRSVGRLVFLSVTEDFQVDRHLTSSSIG
jgi:hypothetical protein